MNQNSNPTSAPLRDNIVSLNVIGLVLGLVSFSQLYIGLTQLYLFDLTKLPSIVLLSSILYFTCSTIYNILQRRFSTLESTSYIFLCFGFIQFLFVVWGAVNRGFFGFTIPELQVCVVPSAVWFISKSYRLLISDILNLRESKNSAYKVRLGFFVAFLFSALLYLLLVNNGIIEHDIKIITACSVLGSVSLVALLQFLASSHRGIKELKWSRQYLKFENRPWKLWRNKYYRYFFFFSATTSAAFYFILVLLVLSFVEYGKAHADSVLSNQGILLMISSVFCFIGISQANTQRISKVGVDKIFRIIPVVLVGACFIDIAIGLVYSFSGLDVSNIRYFIVCSIFMIISVGLTQGFQSASLTMYFSPIDDRQQNSIENIVLGYGQVLALLIVSLALYFIQDSSLSGLPVSDDAKGPVAIGILVVVFCILWSLFYRRLHVLYTELLEDNLDQQRSLIKHEQSFIEGLSTVLSKKIPSSGFPMVLTELKILKILDPNMYLKSLLALVTHGNETVQDFVVREVRELHLIEASDSLMDVMSSRYFPTLRTQRLILKTSSTLDRSKLRSTDRKYIYQLTSSKLPEERFYGSLLARYVDEDQRSDILKNLFGDSLPNIVFNALLSSKGVLDSDTANNVILKLSYPVYANASISSLAYGDDSVVDLLETAFELNRKNEKVLLRILHAYGKIGSEYAVEKLLDCLRFPNHNVVAVALESLCKCGFTVSDPKMALRVRAEISDVCESVIWNMQAVLDATHTNCSTELIKALDIEVQNRFEMLFRLLSLLYDPRSVESVKNSINSDNVEESELASQLLDLFINDEMKTFLIPLLKVSSYQDKIQDLRGVFPTQSAGKRELLVNVVFRDYRWMNSWTKTRALLDLGEFTDDKTADILAAQLVNKNSLLREAAATSLYNNYPELFDDLKTRFNQKDGFHYVFQTLVDIQGKKETGASSILRQEIAEFLGEVKDFADLSGDTLSALSRKVEVVYLSSEQVIHYDSVISMDYYFVYKGLVEIRGGDTVECKGVHSMINPINMISNTVTQIRSLEESVLFKIDKISFEEAMFMDESIAKSILKYAEYEVGTPVEFSIVNIN